MLSLACVCVCVPVCVRARAMFSGLSHRPGKLIFFFYDKVAGVTLWMH